MGDIQNLVDTSLAGVNRNLVKLLQDTENLLNEERNTCADLKEEMRGIRLRMQRTEDHYKAVEGKEKLMISILEEEKESRARLEAELQEVKEEFAELDSCRARLLETMREKEQFERENGELKGAVMRLTCEIRACKEDVKKGIGHKEKEAEWEAERGALLRKIEEERRALEEKEARMREELRQEGRASLQALESMRQRIGKLRGDRRALEEKERELDGERELRMELEAEVDALNERIAELGEIGEAHAAALEEARKLREEVAQLRGKVDALEEEKVVLEEERAKLRATLEEQQPIVAEGVAKDLDLNCLKAGLRVRVAQLEEERELRSAAEASVESLTAEVERLTRLSEDRERQLMQKDLQLKWEQRLSSSPMSSPSPKSKSKVAEQFSLSSALWRHPTAVLQQGSGFPSLFNKLKSGEENPLASPPFKSYGRSSSSPLPKKKGTDRERRRREKDEVSRMPLSATTLANSKSTMAGRLAPADVDAGAVADMVDMKPKKAVTYPLPPPPGSRGGSSLSEDDETWREGRQNISPDSIPQLTEAGSLMGDLELLDVDEEEEEDWDSEMEMDLEMEFEQAKSRALQFIKEGDGDSSPVSDRLEAPSPR